MPLLVREQCFLRSEILLPSRLLFCWCSVTHWWLSLCDPMDCSMPGSPVLHHLPDFVQIHVHEVGDAIQPSHPLSSPSPPAFSLSQHQSGSSELALRIRWPNYWIFSFSS